MARRFQTSGLSHLSSWMTVVSLWALSRTVTLWYVPLQGFAFIGLSDRPSWQVVFNFRADRVVEISKALEYDKFDAFERKRFPKVICYLCARKVLTDSTL